jgi:hypothetical protein
MGKPPGKALRKRLSGRVPDHLIITGTAVLRTLCSAEF